MSLRDDFPKNGFWVIPGVLVAHEVLRLRQILENEYEKAPQKHLLAAPTLLPIQGAKAISKN